MRLPLIAVVVSSVLMNACGTPGSIKPVEYLDDRTAMTVGSLKEPIELVPSLRQGGLHVITNLGKRLSFAYLGPVEWDRSGSIVYGLWVHVAPGNDRPIADIRSNAAITIVLLIHRRAAYWTQSNDYEFSRYSMNEHWQAGRDDVELEPWGLDVTHASGGWREAARPHAGPRHRSQRARPMKIADVKARAFGEPLVKYEFIRMPDSRASATTPNPAR